MNDIETGAALVRWSLVTEHRKPRDRTYPMTPEGDLAAWLDGLSGQIAQDRTESVRSIRKPTTWRPVGGAA